MKKTLIVIAAFIAVSVGTCFLKAGVKFLRFVRSLIEKENLNPKTADIKRGANDTDMINTVWDIINKKEEERN